MPFGMWHWSPQSAPRAVLIDNAGDVATPFGEALGFISDGDPPLSRDPGTLPESAAGTHPEDFSKVVESAVLDYLSDCTQTRM